APNCAVSSTVPLPAYERMTTRPALRYGHLTRAVSSAVLLRQLYERMTTRPALRYGHQIVQSPALFCYTRPTKGRQPAQPCVMGRKTCAVSSAVLLRQHLTEG